MTAASPGRKGLPRPVELLLALAGLAATAPLLLLAGLAVAASSRGPVLFRQERIGRGGHPFVLLKFRTMTQGGAGLRVTAAGDARVTAVGRWLRRSKLDELPELWNVLRGEMSFVGPRPEVAEYVDSEDPRWRRVLAARPGLTDPTTLRLRNEEQLLAAVGGDRDTFYREVLQPFKLAGYIEYLERRSAWGDLAVLWRTAVAVAVPGSVRPPSVDELTAMGPRRDRPEPQGDGGRADL